MDAPFRARFDVKLQLPENVRARVQELYRGLRALHHLTTRDRSYLWKGLDPSDPARELARRWFERDRPWPTLPLETTEDGALHSWGEEGFWLLTLLLHLALKVEDCPMVLSLACSHEPPEYGGTACVLDKNTRHFGGTRSFIRSETRYAARNGHLKGYRKNEEPVEE